LGEALRIFKHYLAVNLTAPQRDELENRLQAYYSDRADGIPWEKLRAK
jgi:putative addiction module component (TIGR02574 family)